MKALRFIIYLSLIFVFLNCQNIKKDENFRYEFEYNSLVNGDNVENVQVVDVMVANNINRAYTYELNMSDIIQMKTEIFPDNFNKFYNTRYENVDNKIIITKRLITSRKNESGKTDIENSIIMYESVSDFQGDRWLEVTYYGEDHFYDNDSTYIYYKKDEIKKHKKGNGRTVDTTILFDERGNKIKEEINSNRDGLTTISYEYDSLNLMVKMHIVKPNNKPTTFTYVYESDENNNWIEQKMMDETGTYILGFVKRIITYKD
ncbi:hypothetical protein M2451_002777 [Dysgonomonas sp. PFB1-18]|uniref:hypothetical protein n=1 Tax=unclassified Dysgonomonas TaxID=2630389 RepID=UPI0024769B72|nr:MULTISPECIES: hypothetical protein [unclassified Dysgonomonas]MDH6309337.1 hypothetical protein [Dysgonomonas sp. PF1-14]MDH6339798.1 hypothetical protein [Dysgonomonas sp. PF1-16]MDH6381446.1 hypothetical protein [Dysgonomonas sp. PFB1-18]MDH6398661.1 hypothetical protein [Dysgonomonas sp. PF1-23]